MNNKLVLMVSLIMRSCATTGVDKYQGFESQVNWKVGTTKIKSALLEQDGYGTDWEKDGLTVPELDSALKTWDLYATNDSKVFEIDS